MEIKNIQKDLAERKDILEKHVDAEKASNDNIEKEKEKSKMKDNQESNNHSEKNISINEIHQENKPLVADDNKIVRYSNNILGNIKPKEEKEAELKELTVKVDQNYALKDVELVEKVEEIGHIEKNVDDNGNKDTSKAKPMPFEADKEIVANPLPEQSLEVNQVKNLGNLNSKVNHSKEQEVKDKMQIVSPGSNRKLLSLDDAKINSVEYSSDVESWKNPSLDIYGNSLLYTNRQFDIAYGHNARKVIAHMPHLIDLNIFNQMHAKFSDQWSLTSSHKLRSAEDMQYEFSYFHFLISEKLEFYVSNIFDEFDTDESKSWSDREIRTLLTRIYSLPLDSDAVLDFEEMITTCASNDSLLVNLPEPVVSDYPPYERYYDSKLPTVVTKELISGII